MIFSYSAKQGPGKKVEGTVEAANLDEAVRRVAALGLTPVDVKGGAPVAPSNVPVSLFSRISDLDISLMTRKMSDLVDAGVPILQVLLSLARQSATTRLGQVLQTIFAHVRDGAALSDAMAEHPGVFNGAYVNMVKAGELSGRLNVILKRLADFLETDYESRAQVRGSLVYPLVILVMSVLTVTAIFIFVIPGIMGVFEDLNQELPWPTRVLMGVSTAFRYGWWAMAMFVAGAVMYFNRLRSSDQGRLWLDGRILALPAVGEYIRVAETGRFARSLATLVESGVDIVRSLDASALLIDNERLRQEIRQLSVRVSGGESLGRAMTEGRVFPDMLSGMITVGEESGQLAQGLYKLADFYDRQTRRSMKQLTALIEPVLILFLGLVVAFILTGTLLPILRMNLMVK